MRAGVTEATSAALGVSGSGGRDMGILVCHEARGGSRLGFALYAAVCPHELLTSLVSVRSTVHRGHWATDLGPLDADVFQAEGTSSWALRGCVKSCGFWPTAS